MFAFIHFSPCQRWLSHLAVEMELMCPVSNGKLWWQHFHFSAIKTVLLGMVILKNVTYVVTRWFLCSDLHNWLGNVVFCSCVGACCLTPSSLCCRIVTGNNTNNKSESDQEDNDDVNDNDWSYGAEKKGDLLVQFFFLTSTFGSCKLFVCQGLIKCNFNPSMKWLYY